MVGTSDLANQGRVAPAHRPYLCRHQFQSWPSYRVHRSIVGSDFGLRILFVAQSYKSIGFAELELKGVAYARAVSSVLADLAGRHPEPGPHLRNFNEARARLNHELATSAASTALISALDASPLNHEGAVDAARFLLTRIGDQSNLLLDPDLASYYVMEVFLRRLPNLIVTSRKVCDELMLARVAGVRSPERTAEILMGVGQLAAGVRALSQSSKRQSPRIPKT